MPRGEDGDIGDDDGEDDDLLDLMLPWWLPSRGSASRVGDLLRCLPGDVGDLRYASSSLLLSDLLQFSSL